MPDNMFRDVVSPSADAGGSRKFTVVISIAAHALAMTAIVVVPVIATSSDFLPTPASMILFISSAPLPIAPPLRRQPESTPRPAVAPAPIPISAPDKVVPEQRPATTEEPADIPDVTGVIPGADDVSALLPQPAPAVPAAAAPLRPGGDIKPPVKIRDAVPEYPRVAQMARVEGIVLIEATIGPDGTVQNARVIRSVALLDAAALAAVRQWQYSPTLLNGTPVSIVMTVTVQFRLR